MISVKMLFRQAPSWKPSSDATDRYASGQIYTKYDNSQFVADELVYGMAGSQMGLWMILPGREYINGGPLHQELTVHKGLRGTGDTKGNILLWMFHRRTFWSRSRSTSECQSILDHVLRAGVCLL